MDAAQQTWRFFRTGGVDQVRLDTADELLGIGQLDQKLWVALSCPVQGLAFDERTLALLDADHDGRVRATELIAAVQWVGQRLKASDVLVQALPGVPLSALRDDDPAGAAIWAAGRTVLDETEATDDMVTVEAARQAQARHAARALAAWEAQAAEASPLGEATAAAHQALVEVSAKVDDWFVRCRLAAFDERAGSALNAADATLVALGEGMLTLGAEAMAALPLAHVQAAAVLPLGNGLNPAWASRIAALHDTAVKPLMGERDGLSEADWLELKDKLAPYAAWLAAKPDASSQDEAIQQLEKLAHFVRDLHTLANNFVAFRDFYTRKGWATFQVGTLYLDGRSTELCVTVKDAAKHAAQAAQSRIFLVYCDCIRGGEKMGIAAAFTAGDSDRLVAGRNGVFYDRQGRDWDATVTRVVEHPISLRQAFWLPYKRMGSLIGEQLQKLAASRAKAVDDKLAASASSKVGQATASATAAKTGSAQASTPAAFDVAKFAGIFAAIGLALGAIGSALAALVAGLFSLAWWQWPLAVAGLMLAVSGPSMVLAWFKLRSRSLGPILDANGWAINSMVRINIPFGTVLTQLAQLPPGAERSLSDPYAEKRRPWGAYLTVLVLVVLAVFAWTVTRQTG